MSTGDQPLQGLELLPDPVVIVGADHRVQDCNTMALRLLARSRGEVVDHPAEEAVPLTDEAGVDWWAATRPFAVDPRLVARIAETDLQCQAADGRSRPVVMTGAVHAGEDGTVSRLVLVLRRGERRRRLDAARSELVSTVSHELRSPLTSVKGFTKTLLAKWDRFSDEQKKQMLETVNEDADRVTRLLGELLDVSRIDAGRLQLRRQMIDMGEVIHRVVDRAAVAAGDDKVIADLPALPRLYADPDKLAQVLSNLVENGLKYGAGTVRISAEVVDDSVRFTVSDEGNGIEPDHLAHVFTKFFRRPGERRTGTGLGLYISKGIVESHGGRMWAESAPNQGARFHFTLPQGGLELAGVSTDMTTRTAAGAPPEGRGQR